MSSFGIKVSFSRIDGDFKKSSTWQNKVLAAPYYSFPFNYGGMMVGGGGSFTWNPKVWAPLKLEDLCGPFQRGEWI